MRAPVSSLDSLAGALTEAAGAPVKLQRPSAPAHGDYASNAALQLAPSRGRPTRELAAELAERARGLRHVERAEVAGPGFLNLWIASAWFGEALGEILAEGDSYGRRSPGAAERVQVELVSANPTGPLTVGHARNAAYGDSVARLLEFAGHEVAREHYVNDVGAQIDLFRASVAARARGGEPPEGGYVGDYVRRLAEHGGDPVERTLVEIRETLERFRVHVDSWVRQADVERSLDDALAELPTYEAEGARWFPATRWGDDKDRVVVRSDGRPTYLAADAAYIRHKLSRGFDRLVYVLGADHHGYVGRLRALAAAYGHDPERVEVLLYQLVHLVERGEARKVSKRRGDVVFLEELMEKIGVDAARWYLVARGHDQAIDIDVELAAERSEKNPVYYVQYAHARIAGILRNAGDAEASTEAVGELAPEERDMVKRLVELPGVVAEATERRAPHALPTYAVRVADDFHRFYHHHRVLGGETQPFRLALCRAAQIVLARCLDLVGIEAPQRM